MMSRYFNKNIYDPQYEKKEMIELFEDEMTLIVGDFWGIQNFIFDRLSTKNAAKVLRSKSAFIQIFTEVLARYICHKLEIDEKYILTTNAGKFEILAPLKDIDLSDVQKKVDTYFLENFYGLSGVIICSADITRDEWRDDYRTLREKIAKKVEFAKYRKFDLIHKNPILQYEDGIDNQALCKICNIRKIETENCRICNIFKDLAKRLTQNDVQKISSDELGIVFDKYTVAINIDKKMKSYIPKKEYGEPLTFEEIANNSCKNSETGIEALGILKADVDGMGKFIKDGSDVTKRFENFDEFSKWLDSFFSLYVPALLRKEYRNIYTRFLLKPQ